MTDDSYVRFVRKLTLDGRRLAQMELQRRLNATNAELARLVAARASLRARLKIAQRRA